MKRIALVDIDTSHPAVFIPKLRSFGYEICGIFDSAAVHPPDVVAAFAEKHGVPLFQTREEAISLCEIGLIHSANWDVHLEHAKSFLQQGRGVFIDKPFAGNVADLCEIKNLVAAGGRISGGSCMLFVDEVEKLRLSEFPPHSVVTGCGVDVFNYGIHAFAAAIGILGFGVRAARFNNEGRLNSATLKWSDDRSATILFGSHAWLPTFITAVSEKGVHQCTVGSQNLYEPLLQRCLAFLSGEGENPYGTPANMIEPELACLAVEKSRRNNGSWVEMDADGLEGISFDGASFVQGYRESRYPRSA